MNSLGDGINDAVGDLEKLLFSSEDKALYIVESRLYQVRTQAS